MKFFLSFIVLGAFLTTSCESIFTDIESYDYSIEQKKVCYCNNADQWMKLYISSDKVFKAVNLSTKEKLPDNELRYYKSIDGLFKIISETDTSTTVLKVKMNPDNNYPAYIYTNPKPEIIDDTTLVIIADGDITYLTRNYQSGN